MNLSCYLVFRKIRAVKQKLALLYPADVAAAQELYRPPAIPDDVVDVKESVIVSDDNNDSNGGSNVQPEPHLQIAAEASSIEAEE